MLDTYDFLKESEVNYLATVDGNKPSCRPFGVPIVYENKIYILTSKDKNVSKQISLNNNVCIVAYNNVNWIRINCKLIDDSDNVGAKEFFLTTFPDLLECGYNLDNPNMQVLYISRANSVIYDEDGNQLNEYNF